MLPFEMAFVGDIVRASQHCAHLSMVLQPMRRLRLDRDMALQAHLAIGVYCQPNAGAVLRPVNSADSKYSGNACNPSG